jgi:hypothetical protein
MPYKMWYASLLLVQLSMNSRSIKMEKTTSLGTLTFSPTQHSTLLPLLLTDLSIEGSPTSLSNLFLPSLLVS